jgi:hypothetical protein
LDKGTGFKLAGLRLSSRIGKIEAAVSLIRLATMDPRFHPHVR